MRRGLFKLRIILDDEKIVDQKLNDFPQMERLFKDVKEKFK